MAFVRSITDSARVRVGGPLSGAFELLQPNVSCWDRADLDLISDLGVIAEGVGVILHLICQLHGRNALAEHVSTRSGA